jgi:hypothetical protein
MMLGQGAVTMVEVEQDVLDAIAAASLGLPPSQRAEFRRLVMANLQSLPCVTLGPGTLHWVIASAQKRFLDPGAVAVARAPSPARSYLFSIISRLT